METTKTIAQVNKVSILMVENGDQLVPIKPICEALGVDVDSQRKKINDDEILSSVTVLSTATGSDKKQYEMVCLPYMYIFGWLFTINPKNVNPEAKETVLKYKQECYVALFKHFADQSDFLKQKQLAVEKQIDEVDRIRDEFKNTKQRLDDARKLLHEIRETTLEDWKENNRQLKINFNEKEE